ncbi:PX domain-containing protein ypt35 [Pseudogymnoascus destructans]|uniref:Endosomal/vacuolar adapter protein YPT35 n=2 Tax=Pseudogymnoascus destructans TaxID=655981 RepID=L8GAA3_PSED2|nr:PX domain-containing protein ypt35 [Pseudogymnoascus destructans]ELR10017.1 hypothetical protein GMDG_00775 [Pseudogymnoascus destructans 20631-21]OAF58269.1 PX domain-containing protein ypt35 [Pseudogymnoascus destructans]
MDVAGDRRLLIHGFESVDHGDDESRTFPASATPLPLTTETSSPITSPPYWVQSHKRSASQVSVDSVLHGGITLHDNTTGYSDSNDACWARSVTIDEHAVVNGNRTGIGAFVVWNITIETLSGSKIHLRKRYSEFDTLRRNLLMTFPLSEASMPPLPPKGVVSKFRPKFLDQRRIGLQYFLNCILLNPEFSSSPVMKDFLFT